MIKKYLNNLFIYNKVQKYVYNLSEKFKNNNEEMNFEAIASEAKCFCCFKKDLYFLVKELTNIEQAFIKASKLLQKLFNEYKGPSIL